MKVYLVGECSCEFDMLHGIYLYKDRALEVYHELRLSLLEDAKSSLDSSKMAAKNYLSKGCWSDGSEMSQESLDSFEYKAEFGDDMYIAIVQNLSEEDPDKMINGPHIQPYLREAEVIE